MQDPLFTPIMINRLEVKNRIYMPAMHMAMAVDYRVTDPLVAFYAERAKGGVGMICVGYATVDELSGNTQNIGAHADAFIPGLARLASAIQGNGARAAIQLNHAGRYNFSFFLKGQRPVAPSAIASRMTGETPRELSAEEIGRIVAAFAQAAERAQKAGFDAVEILSGTGYLISEFLSPLTNQRQDEYGGSLVNRMRFGLEVIRAVRAALGVEFPLIVRMNGNDFMSGGQGRLELQQWAQALVESGVDALCINVGWHEARMPQIIAAVPRGVFAYLARGIKERSVIPVIASHRINDPTTARRLISDGMCDMVAMGRSLIADPQLPRKAQLGRENEILHCIACAQGCFDNLFKLKAVECLCNPLAGHESEPVAVPCASPRKVMVIGGGPAGMSAALAAHDRGHAVSLYEKSDRLGGQLHLAAAPPGREEFLNLAQDLARQLDQKGIRSILNQEVDRDLIEKEKPDVVILATGARPITPPIPGADLPHVAQAWDVLSNKTLTGRNIVVIGGGAVGVETALFLAEKGTLSGEALKFLLVNRAEDPETLYRLATQGTKQVRLIEMIDRVGKDIGRSTRWAMLQELSRFGVDMLTGAKALSITASGVRIEKEGQVTDIQADTVILAAGAVPFHPLQDTLAQMNIPFRLIGDAHQIGIAFDAVHQGYAAGNEI
jgi:2,4-dienoyl-CoA reductase (NADPH2)